MNEDRRQGAGTDAGPPAGGSPSAPGEQAPLNGWGLPDLLLEPMCEVALEGLELMGRSDVPPRLAPLAGRRPRRVGRAERDAVLAGLGRHQRFTDLVLNLFREVHSGCLDDYGALSLHEILDDLEADGDDPSHAACVLVAADRLQDALAVTAWAEQEAEAAGGLVALMGELARESLDARQELKQAGRELAAERRDRKRLERRLARAEQEASAARRRAAEAQTRAREAEARAAELARRHDALLAESAAQRAEIEDGRRERRDLLGELQDLQERVLRLRRALKETRARVPAEDRPAPPPPRPAQAPPSLAELGERFRASGSRGVLDARRILLMVDGWNVGLGQIAAERLEDKRRVLEQALQRYHARTGNRVMVVYDGREVSWFWVPRAGRATIARVFTPEGETADDYIVSELETGTGGLRPVVVTSDRELRGRCMALGAFVLSSERLAEVLAL